MVKCTPQIHTVYTVGSDGLEILQELSMFDSIAHLEIIMKALLLPDSLEMMETVTATTKGLWEEFLYATGLLGGIHFTKHTQFLAWT